MAAISLETAKKHLEMWLEAEEAVATGQSYTIGTRSLTRANLAEVRQQIEYWNSKVTQLQAIAQESGRRNRMFRGVPLDF